MNKNMNFVNRLRISITSARQYKDLIEENLSKAIIYSIILCLITGSLLGIFSFITFGTIQKNMEKVISSDQFKFTLSDGILDFESSPIKEEEGRRIIYIDTNFSLNDIDDIRKIFIHKDESLLVLRDGIFYRINENEYSYKFSEIPLIENLDNEIVLKSLNIIGIIKYITVFSCILITYLNFMLNTFILSLVGFILNKVNNLKIKYIDILKICIYATTLPTLLSLVFSIGSFELLISGIYLILIVNYRRSEVEL